MPDRNPTLDRTPFLYQHCFWGEHIAGSKQELQGLGLGVDLPYPGEPGGPKRAMTVIDPRGLPAQITRGRYQGDAPFIATIRFLGRTSNRDKWEVCAPGVRRSRYWPRDQYVGTAEHLIAAGIVPDGCFPGQPGMRKTSVRIYADGSVAEEAPRRNDRRANECGAKSVARYSTSQYFVYVVVSEAEQERRLRACIAAEERFVRTVSALPRPKPLQPGGASTAPTNAAVADDLDDFVETCEDLIEDSLETIMETLAGNASGVGALHYYDGKTRAKIAAALEHARQLLQAATPSTRQVPSRAQVALPMNAEFREFMAAALKKPGKGPRHG